MLASGRLPNATQCKGPTQNRGKTRTTTRPMPAPQKGREGQLCRNTHGNECDYGFKCHYSTDGSASFGTLQRVFTFFARKGDRCGFSAGWGNFFGEGNAPGSAPLPGI